MCALCVPWGTSIGYRSCGQGHPLPVSQQWQTAAGLRMPDVSVLREIPGLSQRGRWRVSELTPASIQPAGWLGKATKVSSICHSFFWRMLPQTLTPPALSPCLANLSNCCLCVGSQRESTEHASLPQATEVSAPDSAPTLSNVQPC